jgi:hypothetical protein
VLRSSGVVEVSLLLESGRSILWADPQGDAQTGEDRSRVNCHRNFLKITEYRNSSSANPLSTLLTACNAPQRASTRSASTDRLFSVGLSNSLLVGRITIRVKGMTETCKTPGNDPPERRPGEPCCNRKPQAHDCQRHLQDGSPAIARSKFGRRYLNPTLHSRRMFNEADVYGGSREQAAGEHSNGFSNLAHR